MSNDSEMPNTRWPDASAVPDASNGASPHLSDEQLSAWMADELASDERNTVQRHLESCMYCQNALAETQRIRALVGAAASGPQPVVLPSVAERVLARLPDRPNGEVSPSAARPNEGRRQRERDRRNRRNDTWRRLGALAAVLLLIASSVLVFTRLSSQGNSSFKPGPPGVENIVGNWADVLPARSYVADVAVVSPTDIWAVGSVDLGAARTALLIHFDGRYWQRSPDDFPFVELGSISMVSADEGWACGMTDDGKPVMLHYSGGHWRDATATMDTRVFKLPQATLTKVEMASATAGWALGQAIGVNQPSVVFQYLKVGSAYKWEPIESFGDTTLVGMSVVSNHEVWLAGYTGQETWKTLIVRITTSGAAGSSDPVTSHWDTHSWNLGDGQLTSVSMFSSNNGWIGGLDNDGAGILFQWDGQQWSPKQLPPDGKVGGVSGGTSLTAVMTGANSGWLYVYDTERNLLYSTTNDQWFGYQVADGRTFIAGAPVTPTIFLAFTLRVNDEKNFDPAPVIYDMKNGSLIPEPTPTPAS